MNGFTRWLRDLGAKLRVSFGRFMMGRYGTDKLNTWVLGAGVVACIISALIPVPVVKLALTLQERMNRQYPTLARPLALVPERYNQQLTTGSFILEVGSSGNTLQEALAAVRLFGEAAGPLLAELRAEGLDP